MPIFRYTDYDGTEYGKVCGYLKYDPTYGYAGARRNPICSFLIRYGLSFDKETGEKVEKIIQVNAWRGLAYFARRLVQYDVVEVTGTFKEVEKRGKQVEVMTAAMIIPQVYNWRVFESKRKGKEFSFRNPENDTGSGTTLPPSDDHYGF